MTLTITDTDHMERRGRQPRQIPHEIMTALDDSLARGVVKAAQGSAREIAALKRDLARLRKAGWVIDYGVRQLGHDMCRLTFRADSGPGSR